MAMSQDITCCTLKNDSESIMCTYANACILNSRVVFDRSVFLIGYQHNRL